MDTETNEKLCAYLEQLTQGNIEILDDIYILIGKLIYAIALSIVMNQMDAEDIVQNTMVKLVKNAKKFRVRKNALSWICSITRNMSLDLCRKRKRNQEVFPEYLQSSEMASEDLMIISEIFQQLTIEEADLLRAKYWYKFSLSEIAKEFHMKKSTTGYKLKQIELKIQNFYKKS